MTTLKCPVFFKEERNNVCRKEILVICKSFNIFLKVIESVSGIGDGLLNLCKYRSYIIICVSFLKNIFKILKLNVWERKMFLDEQVRGLEIVVSYVRFLFYLWLLKIGTGLPDGDLKRHFLCIRGTQRV